MKPEKNDTTILSLSHWGVNCYKNFNTIDIVMSDSNASFLDAAYFLKSLLPRFRGVT